MSRESASQAMRQIRTLHALGAVGVLPDRQLVERFLESEGNDREDAFAALVQRHGPMILCVCRRMLRESADVEDAFQAVFLVLARKAGSVKRLEALKPWLYGMAVRTAKEARRRSARRRKWEGGAMDDSRAIFAPDESRDDLADLLDEEIDRLPRRYRDALLLCELEGASRQDAARQLGLPEGTLSSRLARGRTLLRDRLTKRGVALGSGSIATLISEPASACLPDSLADTTVRLAVKFAAGGAAAGTVPAAVSTLAEGVLAMISVARLKAILITAISLGAVAGLTAGLAWALGAERNVPQAAVVMPPADTVTPEPDQNERPPTRNAQVHGVVVDDAGRPVAGAEVRAEAFTPNETRGVTGADGSFAIPIIRRRVDGVPLLGRSATDDRLGFFQYEYNLTKQAAEAPARIVLRPGREVVVHVTGKSKVPVPEAAVEAAGLGGVFADATTGRDGSARLHVPADAKVQWIFGLRSGQGFDYAEFGVIDEVGRSQDGAPAASLPASVDLMLDGVRTAQIKAVDSSDKPLSGVGFSNWLVRKEGKRSMVNVWSWRLVATTGPDGIASFDWLPPSKEVLQFWPVGEGYARRRVMIEEGQTQPVTAKVIRAESIRGRITYRDGTPARGIEVNAHGSGQVMDQGFDRTHTAADGTYELTISPGETYAVAVEDNEWAAPSHLGVVVREGKPVEGVDFKLAHGTLLHGTVTVGSNNRPAAKQFIRLDEAGEAAPEEFRQKGDSFSHVVRRQFGAMTDSSGKYSIRVGPGTYTLMGPPRTEDETITIKNEAELVRDFRMPRPEKGTLTGRIVLAGASDRGVAGAKVEIVAANRLAVPFKVTTGADGRFRAERDLDPLVICARNPDGSLGAIVEVGAEDPHVDITLSPTASATGLLVDEQGKPARNQKLDWGRRVYLDEEQRVSMTCFAPKVVTDSEGRFTLPSLVVGQEYGIAVQRGNSYPAAGAVRPEKAGAIDLGTLRVGAYHEKPHPEELSSFRRNAPGPGTAAPEIEATTLDGKPLAVGDFKGRYVLLDFWATWCGPCIGEIPQLQAVHDAFGKDGRFAIVSLSVDEKIEEPRKFQEKRKLPWTQAFLGEGIHGPIPGKFGIVAIPAFVLIGPDGKIVDRGMRGDDIKKSVAKALVQKP